MKNVEVPSVENVTFGCRVDPLLFDVSVTRPLASTVETPLLVTTVHVPLSMVRVGWKLLLVESTVKLLLAAAVGGLIFQKT